MSKHTPGPWVAGKKLGGLEIVFLTGVEPPCEEGLGPCGTWIDCNTEGNANLIAAAPELLEALEAFSNDIVPNVHDDPLWVNARAAIAKAKGAALAAQKEAVDE